MAETRSETKDLIGRKVIDPHGDKVGSIAALLMHGDDERANWASVKLGMFGIRSVFVPLHEAQEEDGAVRVVYEREFVRAAPKVEPDGDHLSDEEADLLHRHYGMGPVVGLTADHEDDDIELSRETRDAKPPAMDQGAFPKPPIPGIPEDEQPSPIKQEDDEEQEGDGEHSSARDEGEQSSASAERDEGEHSSAHDEGEQSSASAERDEVEHSSAHEGEQKNRD